ncbi:hypothetical protein [Sphingobacterium sp. MYb382]|uniref:hypothetical protein n=1 Tax=Sphingobacterium sp. MYb382 TaxID=2745278 RepID=UPI00309C80E4
MKKYLIQTVMNKSVLISFILLLFSQLVIAKTSYFFLDLDNDIESYSINAYTLNTKELYNIDKEVILYNISVNSKGNLHSSQYNNLIILFSVLPTFDESNSLWIELNDFPSTLDLISFKDLCILAENRILGANSPYFHPNNYQVITKKNGKYFKSKNAFVQFFLIEDLPVELNVPKSTIQLNQNHISIYEMEKIHDKYNLNYSPFNPFDYSNLFDNRFERFYLSKKLTIQGMNAYKFWSFKAWNSEIDDLDWDRGVDRFIYIPGKGIVAASLDFYFKDPLPKAYPRLPRRAIDNQTFKNNVISEKVMLAEELK